jgi:hypothetical protein
MKYLSRASIEDFVDGFDASAEGAQEILAYVDVLRERIDKVKDQDQKVKEFAKEEKKQKKKRTVYADSDLTEFLE